MIKTHQHRSDSLQPLRYLREELANLTVTSYYVPAEPPIMTAVRMSDTGRNLIVNFDRSTDKAMTTISGYAFSFDCTQLLDFTGVINSTCKWPSDTQLMVTFSSDYTQTKADVGDPLTLLAGMVTNPCVGTMDCSRLTMVESTTLTIDEAMKPITPVPLLSSPALIGACDDIYLDPSGSLGDGSRPWTSIQWGVEVDIPNNDTSEAIYAEELKSAEILALLETAYTADDIGYVYRIDNDYIWPWAATYTFSLSLTNFFGEIGISTVAVTVDDTQPILRVKLSGVNTNVKYRWQGKLLR